MLFGSGVQVIAQRLNHYRKSTQRSKRFCYFCHGFDKRYRCLCRTSLYQSRGSNGLYDTDYKNKLDAALDTLVTDDFVYLHIEACDEAGHAGDIPTKLLSMENIDKQIVGPLYEALKSWETPVSIAILPDHSTPCEIRTHTSDPVPF